MSRSRHRIAGRQSQSRLGISRFVIRLVRSTVRQDWCDLSDYDLPKNPIVEFQKPDWWIPNPLSIDTDPPANAAPRKHSEITRAETIDKPPCGLLDFMYICVCACVCVCVSSSRVLYDRPLFVHLGFVHKYNATECE